MKHASLLHKTGKGFASIAAATALILLGAYLFFGDSLIFYLESRDIIGDRPAARGSEERLVLGYAFSPMTLEPTHFDSVTRSHLVDMYEGLVKSNRNLQIRPGVAVSWGMLNATTWEFRLRPNVRFHDGTEVRPQDVLGSLDRALNHEASQLKDLLNTIDSYEANGEDRVIIRTRVPDPLLLQKLAVVYIFPNSFDDFEQNAVGTGPYRLDTWVDEELKLQRFNAYWGDAPAFQNVTLKTIYDRAERVMSLENGSIDLLTNMPPSAACAMLDDFRLADQCAGFDAEGIEIAAIPSLEVSFLVFNVGSSVLDDVSVRRALRQLFSADVFVDLAIGFAHPAHQFVSSGVFGFDPEIEPVEYNVDEAQEFLLPLFGAGFERTEIVFDYPDRLEPVGQYVREQLGLVGIDVTLNPLPDAALQQKILDGDSDMYFAGWRSELGDASDFLQAVAHTRDRARGYGVFNGAGYSNANVDALIEESQQEIEPELRLTQMQSAMQLIVEQDVMGVPLFESDTIFGFSEDLGFIPRVDGYVFAAEIT